MKFNINYYVKVKLTDFGKSIYCKEYKRFPEEDSDGWSTFQLWVLMKIFGKHLEMGFSEHPFETEIEIPEGQK